MDLLFFPIDTVKTRLQSSQGFIAAGGFKGVYRGIGSVLVGSAPGGKVFSCDSICQRPYLLTLAAAFFTTYDYLKYNLPPSISHPSPLGHVISASIGECIACLVRVPTEIVKSRMQTSAYGLTASSFDAFGNLIRTDGFSGLYRGFGITIIREVRSCVRPDEWSLILHKV